MVSTGICCQRGEKDERETAMQTGAGLQTGAGVLKISRYEPFSSYSTCSEVKFRMHGHREHACNGCKIIHR